MKQWQGAVFESQSVAVQIRCCIGLKRVAKESMVAHDAISAPLPSQVSCAWGFTTTGGAKGVGESTTSAVVISLVLIFIADFFLSFLFFQGQGDALKQCM